MQKFLPLIFKYEKQILKYLNNIPCKNLKLKKNTVF